MNNYYETEVGVDQLVEKPFDETIKKWLTQASKFFKLYYHLYEVDKAICSGVPFYVFGENVDGLTAEEVALFNKPLLEDKELKRLVEAMIPCNGEHIYFTMYEYETHMSLQFQDGKFVRTYICHSDEVKQPHKQFFQYLDKGAK